MTSMERKTYMNWFDRLVEKFGDEVESMAWHEIKGLLEKYKWLDSVDDWEDAPEWAEYKAKDWNGTRYYYAREPVADEFTGKWTGNCKAEIIGDPDWIKSLKKRPGKGEE